MTNAGLHDRINRILLWDVNVRDLDRSIAFYEELTTLRATPPVLDTEAGVLLDGRAGTARTTLLENSNRAAPWPTLRLMQWIDPEPAGAPSREPPSLGFFRVVIHVSDLDAIRARAERLGAPAFAATTGDEFRFVLGSSRSQPYRVFACHDPDGIVVEFIENVSPKLSVVAQGTGGLERHLGFYTDVLGLDLTDTVETPGPVPNVYTPSGGTVDFSGAFFRVRGDDRGYLDWLEHRDRAGHGIPYPEPEHVGVIRCLLEVDDLDAARGTLAAARWEGGAIRMGEVGEVELGGALGRRRVLPFLDPEGVRYALVEQGRYPWARLHPHTRRAR
jgi:catechol 2,3-dioxygenase-like lactoylglutathione lyase family enzyme